MDLSVRVRPPLFTLSADIALGCYAVCKTVALLGRFDSFIRHVTAFRKWFGAALLTAAVLGCSASSVSAAQAASPAEIQPTWTPVHLPAGYDGYITDLCFDHNWVILTASDVVGYGHSMDGMGVAYGGRC